MTPDLPDAGSTCNLSAAPEQLVREALAADLLDVEDQLVLAVGDAEAYRFALHAALARLHEAQRTEAGLRRQLSTLRDELRRYTERQALGRVA